MRLLPLILFTGCVVANPCTPVGGGKTPSPGVSPSVTASPTVEASPTYTPEPMDYIISAPLAVDSDAYFEVSITTLPTDEVKIYADKKFFVSATLWDESKQVHFMKIHLHDKGPRILNFQVNGEWKVSTTIVVK